MKKVIILIGNYGSGKTEIALNMALLISLQTYMHRSWDDFGEGSIF